MNESKCTFVMGTQDKGAGGRIDYVAKGLHQSHLYYRYM
jgi:hypothetical protein